MYSQNRAGGKHAPEPTQAPSRCPACQSEDVKTTSKVANAESYWRCVSCGEVWNVGRREPASQRSPGSFGRYR